jgi:hypothetical protein
VGVAIGRCLESEAGLPSIQSLSQNFRAHNTCSDGLTGTAANRLEPGYFSRGGKSVVILPNHEGVDKVRLPGEPERESMRERMENGIPLDENSWQSVLKAASVAGMDDDTIAALTA